MFDVPVVLLLLLCVLVLQLLENGDRLRPHMAEAAADADMAGDIDDDVDDGNGDDGV